MTIYSLVVRDIEDNMLCKVNYVQKDIYSIVSFLIRLQKIKRNDQKNKTKQATDTEFRLVSTRR